ncbi:MAG: hypothetical protein COA94_05630 [Rickettsiales bacterium]|nr:MAG: hypothetical protein COA94_05630 [Rickettsiales bacterium]
MELEIILKALLSLGFVFAVMYVLLKIMQKYSNVGSGSKLGGAESGLKIENILYIDGGTKIINIANKSGSNYVIAVAKNNSFLIDKYKTKKEE